jgi:D-alanine-D-alanine ligase-like ATP-grasp enzyme
MGNSTIDIIRIYVVQYKHRKLWRKEMANVFSEGKNRGLNIEDPKLSGIAKVIRIPLNAKPVIASKTLGIKMFCSQ